MYTPVHFPVTLNRDFGALKAVWSLVECALDHFDLDPAKKAAGIHHPQLNIIVRHYTRGNHIPFHIDRSCFDEPVIGIVLQNTNPSRKGLAFALSVRPLQKLIHTEYKSFNMKSNCNPNPGPTRTLDTRLVRLVVGVMRSR